MSTVGAGNSIPLPLEIQTERLILRSPRIEDAAALCEAIQESLPQLRPWMPWAQDQPAAEKTEGYIRRALGEFEAQTAFRIHLFDRHTGQIVGSSGYPRVDLSVPKLEIGYWIRTSRTGCGLCSEVVRALTGYAIESIGAHRVEIYCDDNNQRSWRVAERVGFTLEGVLRNECLDCGGQLRNTRVYSMLPCEWTRNL